MGHSPALGPRILRLGGLTACAARSGGERDADCAHSGVWSGGEPTGEAVEEPMTRAGRGPGPSRRARSRGRGSPRGRMGGVTRASQLTGAAAPRPRLWPDDDSEPAPEAAALCFAEDAIRPIPTHHCGISPRGQFDSTHDFDRNHGM
jgi:hypothetical protein